MSRKKKSRSKGKQRQSSTTGAYLYSKQQRNFDFHEQIIHHEKPVYKATPARSAETRPRINFAKDKLQNLLSSPSGQQQDGIQLVPASWRRSSAGLQNKPNSTNTPKCNESPKLAADISEDESPVQYYIRKYSKCHRGRTNVAVPSLELLCANRIGQDFAFYDFEDPAAKMMFNLLNPHSVQLISWMASYYGRLLDSNVQLLAHPSVTTLTLHGNLTDEGLYPLLPKIDQESEELDDWEEFDFKNDLPFEINGCISLTCLDLQSPLITHTFMKDLCLCLPTLKELRIRACFDAQTGSRLIFQYLPNVTGLQCIDVSFSIWFDDRMLQHLCTSPQYQQISKICCLNTAVSERTKAELWLQVPRIQIVSGVKTSVN